MSDKCDSDCDCDYNSECDDCDCNHDEEAEDDLIIRAKSSIDGAKTLDEAIDMLYDFIDYLRNLKNLGYELRDPVEDDYGFLKRTSVLNPVRGDDDYIPSPVHPDLI